MPLAKERFGVDLLIAAEAAGAGKDFLRQGLTQELLRHFVGLGGQIHVSKGFGIDRLSDEPGVDQRDLIVGVVGIVSHLQVHLTLIPGFAGVEHGRVLCIQRLKKYQYDMHHMRSNCLML